MAIPPNVMEAMMAQQMQFQLQMMSFWQCQQQQDLEQMLVEPKVKEKCLTKKQLDVPAKFQQHTKKYDTLSQFMESCRLEDKHKERLMVAMAERFDTFQEDLETLQMAMGGARKFAGGSEAALLVSLVKQMEDGEFMPRDEKDRAVFRRAKEIKEEAIAANSLIKLGGSVREKFLAQQRVHSQEMVASRERAHSPRSRSHGNKRRSRSRSHGQRHSRHEQSRSCGSRGCRDRSSSRGRRGRDRR